MTYVDGFVIPMPKSNKGIYRKMAQLGGKMWKKHGALDYCECVAEELNVLDPATGKRASPFVKQLRLKPGETVVFSWIVFKSKAHRNAVNAAVMKDPAMSMDAWKDKPMPFDIKRVCYGGFVPIVRHVKK